MLLNPKAKVAAGSKEENNHELYSLSTQDFGFQAILARWNGKLTLV